MNIFDKMIEKISPRAALQREADRFKLETIRSFRNSGYDESGASRSKNSMKGWRARSLTPQEDIDQNLPTLRQRSRSLFMSAPLATSAIKTNRTNIVGQGLRLKSTIDAEFLHMTHEQAQEWQRAAEREFNFWASKKLCDATRVNNFYEIQQVACLNWLMNGDACCLIEYDKSAKKYFPYGLRLHLIESDRVSTPQSAGTYVDLMARNPATKNRIFNGVEVDSRGKVVAYHICSSYPGSNLYPKKTWTRVKAFGDRTGSPNVLMIYESERAEQYRGVPYLAPVIESLKQLTRYSDAEMMAAVINGFFTVFVTSESGVTDQPFTGVTEEGDNVTDDDISYELGPGMVNVLQPGEKIEIADAKRPATNFDAFVSALAKYIGAALEIPYELLMKSFNASYSASRAAILEAWKAFKMKRTWLANDLCQPVYEMFLAEAIASGRLRAPGFFLDPLIKEAYCKAQWNGPAQGMIDPLKEVNAAEKRISLNLSTHDRETTEMTGGDFESNIRQLQREKKLIADLEPEKAAAPEPGSDTNNKEEGEGNEKNGNSEPGGDPRGGPGPGDGGEQK
ncbi:phage portal protein [Blautia schinkii]|nr:phage portal protein [Blautia schinkii]